MKVRSAIYAPILFGVVMILVGLSSRFYNWMGGISADPYLVIAILQFLVFLLPLASYGIIRGKNFSSVLKLNGFPVRNLPFVVMMTLLMFTVILFFRYVGLFWFRGAALTNTPSAVFLADPAGNVVLKLLCDVLLSALLEELLCRGILLEEYRSYGDGFAVCMSAVMFALLHINAANLFFYFCLGLILGAVTVVTGSLIPAVAMHVLCNLSYHYLRPYALEYVRNAGRSPLFPLLLFALILLMFFLVFSRMEDLYRDESLDEMADNRKELLYKEMEKNKPADEEKRPGFWRNMRDVWLSPSFLVVIAAYVLFAANVIPEF